ncbi:MAG TPA: methyltransferase domain-containing protein [Intrasporangium sp.]|uniref:class I SAM-dependent methyltransferase n=1 Tax=Intrasporangium sp. TaxID=1925024 RepID=UPI002D787A8D|nr:methyltransferase domain-containing protein [Intrasporangium sp.]HET7399333.1 methyltransferase domain-containing protein [Intrasporangium sp.]
MPDERPPQQRAATAPVSPSVHPPTRPTVQHPTRPPLRPSAVASTVVGLARESSDRLGRPLDVLDLGGGTGNVAVALAEAGHRVTVVDPSPDALAALARRAREAGLPDRVTGVQGDSDSLPTVLAGQTVDLVCCHGVLEFVDDPSATLRAIAAALRPGGWLSLLVAGRLAVVFAKAIAGEFGQARTALVDPDGRWGAHDPLPRRFDLDEAERLLTGAGFSALQTRATTILGHLVPAALLDSEADRAALTELDELLVSGPGREFLRTLGSGLHVLARRD